MSLRRLRGLCHRMAAAAPKPLAFAVEGPIARADLPGLCARVCALLGAERRPHRVLRRRRGRAGRRDGRCAGAPSARRAQAWLPGAPARRIARAPRDRGVHGARGRPARVMSPGQAGAGRVSQSQSRTLSKSELGIDGRAHRGCLQIGELCARGESVGHDLCDDRRAIAHAGDAPAASRRCRRRRAPRGCSRRPSRPARRPPRPGRRRRLEPTGCAGCTARQSPRWGCRSRRRPRRGRASAPPPRRRDARSQRRRAQLPTSEGAATMPTTRPRSVSPSSAAAAVT